MAVVLQEAKCEATPLLERVLCSLHVVRPCDAVATEGVLFGVVWRNGERDVVRQRQAGES